MHCGRGTSPRRRDHHRPHQHAGVPETDAGTHLRALAEWTHLIREWNQFLTRMPLVLAPVCTELPYAHGFDVESVAQGLPVGVQVMGARCREDMTLAAAAAIEARWMRITPIDPK